MPTLRALLQTANGLYLDGEAGAGCDCEALATRLPEEALARALRLSRVAPFVYHVCWRDDGSKAFVLYSRRRRGRDTSGARSPAV